MLLIFGKPMHLNPLSLKKIRSNIEQHKIQIPEGIIQKTISLGFSEFPQIPISYIGAEYSAGIIALTTAHFPLLQRNLLYTAMTRGKHLVI